MTNQDHRPDEKQDEDEGSVCQPLCVNCRRTGHVRRECSVPWPGKASGQGWSYSADRTDMIDQLMLDCNHELCKRCQHLDLISMFSGDVEWKSPRDLVIEQVKDNRHYRNLGPVGTTEYLSKCPMCICLFALAPNPDSQNEDFHIIADWTIRRMERLAHIEIESRGRYDICIMVHACSSQGALQLDEPLGDALCLKRDYEQHRSLPLGAQLVNRRQLDIDLMKRYVTNCARLHPFTCLPRQSDELEAITLIDVEARTIVPFPGQPCEYLTLSYVWGEIDASRYVKNNKIVEVPKTIEDAMALTLLLGKRYLWVDLFCVDQVDESEKNRQIQRMSNIYTGAFASIVAMSGATMESGLARMPGSTRQGQPQLSCQLQDHLFIGLMPTLSQQIQNCKWGTRAWTLQEAVLSPRCFYLTDHQVYFECNAMQCCESLDEEFSWIHQSLRDHKAIRSDPAGHIYGHGTLRKTFDGDGKPQDHLEIYSTLTTLYSGRNMTDPNDVINAYTGIIQHLTSLAYSEGFFWGLPIPEFTWALLWFHIDHAVRRPGKFPAWSWAGWKGGQVLLLDPHQQDGSLLFCTHFRACGVEYGKLKQIHPLSETKAKSKSELGQGSRILDQETPFDGIESLPFTDEIDLPDFDLEEAELQGYLLLECAVCNLQVKYTQPNTDWEWPPYEIHDITISQIPCILRSAPGNFECERGQETTIQNLALVARTETDGYISHYFLRVYFDSGPTPPRGSRTGRVFQLLVPMNESKVYQAFDVQNKQLIMT